jgi:hypothetical protein
MTFQIKHKKQKLDEDYWKNRRVDYLIEKHHGKMPKISEINKLEWEYRLKSIKRIHTKGELIKYKNEKLAVVKQVTPKGVWITEFEGKDAISGKTNPKTYFVPAKEYEVHA